MASNIDILKKGENEMKLILTLAVAVAVILACAVAGCKIFGRRDKYIPKNRRSLFLLLP